MLKYLLFSLPFLFVSCTTDPLELREVKSEETMPGDGLEILAPSRVSSDWKESDGVLTATAPAELSLLPQAGAYTLSLSLLVDPATRGHISIGGGARIELPSVSLVQDSTRRYGAGQLQPGVWQDLEIAYQPATASSAPLLVGAYLNGNLIYYLQPIEKNGGAEESVSVVLEAGTLSIDDLRYAGRAGKGSQLSSDGVVSLNIPLMTYAYYEADEAPADTAGWNTLTPKKDGFISRFDLFAIRERGTNFGIRFTGNFDVPKGGAYTFGSSTRGEAKIYIDGNEILEVEESSDDEDKSTEVTLGEGSHRLAVDYFQPGNRTQLNFWYTAPGGTRTALNDMSGNRNIVRPPAEEVTEIALDERPYLLRSFLNFPAGKVYDYGDKLTHVVSVGEREGPNYSYNLRSGNILQVWRGRFVDVGEMWVGRGEAQVARPLGEVVAFNGSTTWSTSVDEWTDSLTDIRHLRYDLDQAGRPTFTFGDDEETTQLTDHIVPSGSGLERTLTNADGDMVRYALLGTARNITELESGKFSLRGPGMNIEVQELASGSLNLVRGENIDRLVAELPPGEHITYSINW